MCWNCLFRFPFTKFKVYQIPGSLNPRTELASCVAALPPRVQHHHTAVRSEKARHVSDAKLLKDNSPNGNRHNIRTVWWELNHNDPAPFQAMSGENGLVVAARRRFTLGSHHECEVRDEQLSDFWKDGNVRNTISVALAGRQVD